MSQYKLITVSVDAKDLREITLAANAVQQDSELTAYERYQLFLSISDTVWPDSLIHAHPNSRSYNGSA